MTNDEISHSRYIVRMGTRGRVVLPAEVRRRLGLGEGDCLILVEDGPCSLRLTSPRDLTQQLRGSLRPWTKGRSLVDELSEERRQECLRAIEEHPLRLGMTWEEIRRLTREP